LVINKPVQLDIYTLADEFLDSQSAAVDNYTYYEFFDDTVGSLVPGSSGEKPINGCFHEKHRWIFQKDYPDWVDFNRVDGNPYPFPSHPDVTTALVPDLPQATLRSLALDAYNEFHSQMPTVVSIANFLWELREMKDLIPKITKNLLGSANGAFLGYQFGWKPFLDDLGKLGKLSSAVQKRLKFLKDNYGKRTRIHFYRSLDTLNSVYPSGWNTPWGTALIGQMIEIPNTIQGEVFFTENMHLYGRPTEIRQSFRASGYLYQKLEGLDGALSDLAAFSAALGLNNPAKIIWNAIPYSFVADWFVKISPKLDTWQTQPFDGVWQVTNVSSSVTTVATVDFFAHPWPEYGNPLIHCGRVQAEKYIRYIGLPVAVDAIDLNPLDANRQMLLGSLLFQRSKLSR